MKEEREREETSGELCECWEQRNLGIERDVVSCLYEFVSSVFTLIFLL